MKLVLLLVLVLVACSDLPEKVQPGLKNLGSTYCYLLSLIQCLYGLKGVRESILNTNSNNLVHQSLSALFSRMSKARKPLSLHELIASMISYDVGGRVDYGAHEDPHVVWNWFNELMPWLTEQLFKQSLAFQYTYKFVDEGQEYEIVWSKGVTPQDYQAEVNYKVIVAENEQGEMVQLTQALDPIHTCIEPETPVKAKFSLLDIIKRQIPKDHSNAIELLKKAKKIPSEIPSIDYDTRIPFTGSDGRVFRWDTEIELEVLQKTSILETGSVLAFHVSKQTFNDIPRNNAKVKVYFAESFMLHGKEYVLQSISVHSGINHYTAVIKVNGKWYEFDDENVIELQGNVTDIGTENVNSFEGYEGSLRHPQMLFYVERTLLEKWNSATPVTPAFPESLSAFIQGIFDYGEVLNMVTGERLGPMLKKIKLNNIPSTTIFDPWGTGRRPRTRINPQTGKFELWDISTGKVFELPKAEKREHDDDDAGGLYEPKRKEPQKKEELEKVEEPGRS